VFIPHLSSREKQEVNAILCAFNFSGFDLKLSTRILKYHKSFVGRDFKALAQCALFVFNKYFTTKEKAVWVALSKVYTLMFIMYVCDLNFLQVFQFSYCDNCSATDKGAYQDTCGSFVKAVMDNFPEFGKKVKIHLLLHLPDSITDFGPTSAFNTERLAVIEH
jgi:hypothetical protein